MKKDKIWELFEDLFPIYRTLLGEGFEKSLEIINSVVPLTNRYKISSGTPCGSWKIPNEWKVNKAWIANLNGEKILDFEDSPFLLWQYSISTNEIISHEKLMERVSIGNHDSIPLRVTYYKERWGFSLSENQLSLLNQMEYKVFIDTTFSSGLLSIGEILLEGESGKQIIIDSVLSCNSLANNLSGVAAAVYLADRISRMSSRYYSYRILFTPETLGPIALAYHYETVFQNTIGGFNLINLADHRPLQYKRSRRPTLIDQAVEYVLKKYNKHALIKDYDVMTGQSGNEKAYNSLGLEINLGSVRRSELSSYPEYDTSADDMDYIDKLNFFESLDLLEEIIKTIELNLNYRHTFRGEPFLTGYGLFPNIESEKDRIPYDYLMGFTDGKHSLIDLAKKSNQPMDIFIEAVSLMLKKGLISK